MKTTNTNHSCYGISVIDTGYLRERFAASHLLVENGKAAFIDVGTNFSVGRLTEALHAAGLKDKDVLYIILTHIHLDHAGATGALVKCFPNASVVVHPKGAQHICNPEKLILGSIAVYGKDRFDTLYGELLSFPSDRLLLAEDGLVLDFESRKLHFFDTPGHARHHVCIWDPVSKGIFTGDTFGLGYPELQTRSECPFLICTTSPAAFDPDDLLLSIEKLERLKPETLFLTHFGPVSFHPEASLLLKQFIKIHKEMALKYHSEPDVFKKELTLVFEKAFTEYTAGIGDIDELRRVLADDIELNVQGASIWAKRKLA